MSIKPAKVQLNGGELSPWLEGRVDIARYNTTAKLCRNFIPLAEGSLKRRGGTRFVAATRDDEGVLFKIVPDPVDAKVVLNGIEANEIYVARGDEVSYEVSADGYEPKNGELEIVEETVLAVRLVSLFENCVLTINPTPTDAVVKIEGYARRSYRAKKNSSVTFVVYKNGYKLYAGSAFMDKDKTLDIVLEAETAEAADFGDWGAPLDFIACSAVGDIERQIKCFMLRFENGYLPILFAASQTIPEDVNERMFFYTKLEGYNAVYFKDGAYHLAAVADEGERIVYKDLNGDVLYGLTKGECMWYGWQYDELGKYASIYPYYDGVATGGGIEVYYNGELVFELKGRKNNG